jgi:hypothetical protein
MLSIFEIINFFIPIQRLISNLILKLFFHLF